MGGYFTRSLAGVIYCGSGGVWVAGALCLESGSDDGAAVRVDFGSAEPHKVAGAPPLSSRILRRQGGDFDFLSQAQFRRKFQ